MHVFGWIVWTSPVFNSISVTMHLLYGAKVQGPAHTEVCLPWKRCLTGHWNPWVGAIDMQRSGIWVKGCQNTQRTVASYSQVNMHTCTTPFAYFSCRPGRVEYRRQKYVPLICLLQRKVLKTRATLWAAFIRPDMNQFSGTSAHVLKDHSHDIQSMQISSGCPLYY